MDHTVVRGRPARALAAAVGLAVLASAGTSLANPVTGELFFTRHSTPDGNPLRVGKVTYSYDGVSSFTFSSLTTLATGIGADGIVGNPQQSSSVIVGGQGSVLHRVDRSGGGVLQSVGGLPNAAFHLEVPFATRVLSTGIPGATINSTEVLGTGALGSTVGITYGGGLDAAVTQVITTPYGYRYTRSGPNGFGNYGELAFTDPALTSGVYTTLRQYGTGGTISGSTLIAAHGGFYDPFSDSVIIVGEHHVTQINTITGAILADLDVSGFGVSDLDQGTTDGAGHIFVADGGNGRVLFIDFSDISDSSKLISDASVFKTSTFLIAGLDDVAPLVGEGSTTPVPAPASLALFGFGMLGLRWLRRRRR